MRLEKIHLNFAIIAFISTLPALAMHPTVVTKSGNVYLIQAPEHRVQITHSGKDFSPVLSSNNKLIAFIRTTNKIIPEQCNAGSKYGHQIWVYDTIAKKETLLVDTNFECSKPEKQITSINQLSFSPDDKILYFLASAWTTSNALHRIDLDGKNQHYIVPALSLELIPKGEYKGYLIVSQHRYFFPPGGSYDWYWVLDPNGKVEGPLGEEITNEQRKFLLLDSMS